jgi:RHH-type rel operon transcriptional repressor/antitoxin RelB
MLTIQLPGDAEARLETLAQAGGKTAAYYAQEAILDYLEDMEDYYLAEQAVADIRAGRDQTYPLEEVMKEYGLKVED